MYSHRGTSINAHTHTCSFFSPVVIPRIELELPEEIIITLQVASPTGTVFHNEQELKSIWIMIVLFPSMNSLIYSICIPCS